MEREEKTTTKKAKPLGIRLNTRVLLSLKNVLGKLTTRKIAREAQTSRNIVSVIMNRLEKKELVIAEGKVGRTRKFSITEKGEKIIKNFAKISSLTEN